MNYKLTWMANLDFLTKNGLDVRKWCYGKTPMETFLDSIPLAKYRDDRHLGGGVNNG